MPAVFLSAAYRSISARRCATAASFRLNFIPFPGSSKISLRFAKWGARRIWKSGYRYAKAGLMTVDLVPLEASQRALIGALDREKSGRLMAALDACNAQHGRGAVFPAASGVARQRKAWVTKFDQRSPRYTTRLDEVPVIGSRAH